MSKLRSSYDDEIDLFVFFETLWDEKWLLTTFIVFTMLLGGIFKNSLTPTFISKIYYAVDSHPPFYSEKKVSSDFKKMFYSKEIFEEWQNSNGKTQIVFDDFSKSKVIDGFVFAKDQSEQLAEFSVSDQGSYLQIKSNQFAVLGSFSNYTRFINSIMGAEYLKRANEELVLIKARSLTEIIAGETVLSIYRYVLGAENGEDVLSIQPPSIPKSSAPNTSAVLSLSAALGIGIGAFFIFIRNAIRKRKKFSS